MEYKVYDGIGLEAAVADAVSGDTITVSGLNHRLKKIIEIYEDIISR